MAHEHQHAPERQVNADLVIEGLRRQISDQSLQMAIKDAVISDLENELHAALHRIDELAPTEEISDVE